MLICFKKVSKPVLTNLISPAACLFMPLSYILVGDSGYVNQKLKNLIHQEGRRT